jgi:hypothetical protein
MRVRQAPFSRRVGTHRLLKGRMRFLQKIWNQTGTRPTVRHTPVPAQPSSLRREWVPSPNLPQTPSRLQSALAYFGLSPKPSPRNLDSPRIRRSARLRHKTPRRGLDGEEETEIIYEYRGDTLGGRDLLPEFFGEHDIIQGVFFDVTAIVSCEPHLFHDRAWMGISNAGNY